MIKFLPQSFQLIDIFSNCFPSLFCSNRLHLNLIYLSRISSFWIRLLDCVPNILSRSQEHTCVANLRSHRIPQSRHNHRIFFIPCFKTGISWFRPYTHKMVDLPFPFQHSANKLRPFKVIFSIQPIHSLNVLQFPGCWDWTISSDCAVVVVSATSDIFHEKPDLLGIKADRKTKNQQ